MMKSPNLTQINLRNDPINRRIQGYSFRNSEDEVWCSRCDFIQFSRSKFEFQHSIEAQLGYEHKETNGARFDSLNKEKSKIYRGHVLRRDDSFLYKRIYFSAVGSCGFIAMDGRDQTAIRESSSSLVIVGF